MLDVSNVGKVEKYATTSETKVYSNWVFVHRYIFHLFRPDRGAGAGARKRCGMCVASDLRFRADILETNSCQPPCPGD